MCTTSLTYFVFVVFPQSLYLEPFFIIFECLFPLSQNCTYNYGAFYSNITKKLNSWQIRESSGSFK